MTATNQPSFKSAQSFVATGRGYYNAVPNFPATTANANGLFQNPNYSPQHKNYQMPVFVVGISTGWEVTGQYGQAGSGRTFFPNNLNQNPLTIEGIVANQYEYDRLVEFMLLHQQTATQAFVNDPSSGSGPSSKALTFTLKPYKVDTGRKDNNGQPILRTIYGSIPGLSAQNGGNGSRVRGYIQTVQAGHQRFVNAINYTLSLQISYDYSQMAQTQAELYRQLQSQYMGSFNSLYGRKPDGQVVDAAFQTVANTIQQSDYWSPATPGSNSGQGHQF